MLKETIINYINTLPSPAKKNMLHITESFLNMTTKINLTADVIQLQQKNDITCLDKNCIYLIFLEIRDNKNNIFLYTMGFPGGSDSREPACSAGDPDAIPGSGRSPGEGNGNPFQSSRQENPMDKGPWWATVHRVSQSRTLLK